MRKQIRRIVTALPFGFGYGQVVWLLLGFVGLLLPATAWGQAGYYLHPALSVAEYYDDNVFRSVSKRQDDMVTRFGAGADVGYESAPLTLLGHYRFASEIYAKHPELNEAFILQDAGAKFAYLPTRLWTLGFVGGWVDTKLPETINVPTGILGERLRTRSYYVSPSIQHAWDPRTTLSTFYTFNNTTQEGTTLKSHTARLAADRQLRERDTLHFGYTFRKFIGSSDDTSEDFPGAGEDFADGGSVTAHIPTVGWSHRLSVLTAFTVNIGPRFSRGDVTPEVLATVSRELRNGKVSLIYERTQYTVVGRGEPTDTDSVILVWERQLLNRLFVTATPGFYNNAGDEVESRVYAFEFEALYQINKWLGFRASYQLTYEEGRLFRGIATHDDRIRNLVLFELVASYPLRLY